MGMKTSKEEKKFGGHEGGRKVSDTVKYLLTMIMGYNADVLASHGKHFRNCLSFSLTQALCN